MRTGSSPARMKTADRELSLEVKQTLQETHCAVLQRVRCRVADGTVELSGDVPSFYFKQLAQEVLLTLNHVHRIENRLHVRCSS
jgi:osmotically-inducible protein OsmY